MEARPLLLASVALLLAAAPNANTKWYSIVAENGKPIGYGYVEWAGPLDHKTLTYYQEFSAARPGKPVMRITDRAVVRYYAGGRRREIVERIVIDGDWTKVRTAIDGSEAIVRRTTADGEQVKRLILPPRLIAYDMFAPQHCVWPADREPMFELDTADMAINRVVVGDMTWDDDGLRYRLWQHIRSGEVRAVERIGYDGECELAGFTKTEFGVTVRMKPVDRRTALKGAKPIG